MKTKFRTLLVGLALLSTINSQLSTALAQSTAFTYQGQLAQSGLPYDGLAEMQFTLFDAPSNGVAVTPIAVASVNVSGGLFTVPLNFGAGTFSGGDRWLEIAVRTNGAGAFATLAPRQAITPTPYSITAYKAIGLTGTLPASQLSGTLPSAQLSGAYSGGLTFNNSNNAFVGSYVGDGSGLSNVNASSLGGLNSSSFWKTTGNAGANPTNGAFLGTTDNQPLEIKVNGIRALRLEPTPNDAGHSNIVNVVGGSPVNFVGAGAIGATIGGGGAVNYTNKVLADFGTAGGGRGNTSSDRYATVGGGALNTSSGEAATVGGGGNNTSSGWGATVGGGLLNTSSGGDSTVGGGTQNTSSGLYATVPGGHQNSAAGDYSFAAGLRAKANHEGAFVWADVQGADFASTAANQFSIRAASGVRIYNPGDGHTLLTFGTERSWAFRQLSTGAGTALELGIVDPNNPKDFIIRGNAVGINTTAPGFTLHVNGTAGKPGGGSWTSTSDARLKKNIRPLAGALDKLLALHGVTFEYINPAQIHELSGERMGLVAQEVEKVFPDWVETGADGYKRMTVRGLEALVVEALRELQQQKDADVRGLNQKFTEELKRRDADNAELKRRLEKLEELLGGRSNGGTK
jgi:hypothetical protein